MGRCMTLKEAAEFLGSTSEAVRKRAKRGTIPSETGEDGMLYVWVDGRVDAAEGRGTHRVDATNGKGSHRVERR